MRARFIALRSAGFALTGILANAVAAEDIATGLGHAGTRTVLTGVPGEDSILESGDKIELMVLRALQGVLDQDALLGDLGIVMNLYEPFEGNVHQLGPNGIPRRFRYPFTAPHWSIVDGTDSFSNAEDLNSAQHFFVSNRMEQDFAVTCLDPSPVDHAFAFCGMHVAYTPDPAVMIQVRIYRPTPFADFGPALPAIADRVREIVRCLDVTDDPPDDGLQALDALLAANPELRGCSVDLQS